MALSKRDQLIEEARQARTRAFAPYSRFPVGAAVRIDDGAVYQGCNVESSAYGLTVCAERVAIYNAISDGAGQIVEVAVIADTPDPPSPCGACRQVMWEQARGAWVNCANLDGDKTRTKVRALLPKAFDGDSLPGQRKPRTKRKVAKKKVTKKKVVKKKAAKSRRKKA